MPAARTALEAAYLHARELDDRAELAAALGPGDPDLTARAAQARDRVRADLVALGGTDDPAVAAMLAWAGPASGGGGEDLAEIERAYAREQGAVHVGGQRLTRLAVLGLLGREPDPHTRRDLFLALRPVWAAIDGDGDDSPYRRMLPDSARRWAGGGPVAANATALGLDPASVEPDLVAVLDTWRQVSAARDPIEPWDWWYVHGTTARVLREATPVGRLRPLSDAYHAALGADPAALDVRYDTAPRPDRPPVPVAYTTFGSRPRPGRRAQPWVLGTYTAGGLGELTELVHETGHALHVAAIDTRPAYADWPDSDAFTEAVAELTALDTAEPAWQRRWLGGEVPEPVSLRDRYADVMLDVCWALLEIRLHADPTRRPNDVWAELTSTYLGVVAHPELSWWAMRGQLVQEPGYMVNYALGPIIAADLRAAVRAVRGDWTGGDPGWYGWVSAHVYRWGLSRGCGQVLRDVLGRAPSATALLAQLRRAG
ncbi:hypothetical protein [Catellatospora tritici]|uniref:hypothetical protein n=1 Tax=Catellatospora tritici TaxID=2851566 RepID=UPI001C2DD070|nr:hypothetical protein [Catellatospora tritici]MBV1850849.1 hypothetical protein [Catellatospora tritici]MBV1851102.1 hypothetical protein [Catellatospora tritici]